MPRLLEGAVLEDRDERDARIAQLERDIERLQRELRHAQLAAEDARQDATRAFSALRQQLSPLYRALQMVFGELDAAGVTEAPGTQPAAAAPGGRDARELALWTNWKANLPPACGKVIDALLLHNDLTAKQLKVAARMGENSIYQATSRLGQAGLINKNAGRFSLKAL